MLIKYFQVGQLETNCYIATDETTLSCAVIDPGDEASVILDYIETNKLKVEVVFLTHGHFDHTMAAYLIAQATGAHIYINRQDTHSKSLNDVYKFSLGDNVFYYGEGDTVKVGNLLFEILETPGHSPGSVTLRCEDAIFTGDILFRDSCGRYDLPGGDLKTMLTSLKKLGELEGDFEVYPGHMDVTSLDRERRFNDYMKYASEQE